MIFVNSYTSFPVVVAPPATGDPDYSSVILLAHADSSPIDTSPLAISLGNTSSVGYSTTIKKYGAASFSFSSGNYLSTPSSTAYSFGSGNFTIEFWANFTSIPSNPNLRAMGNIPSGGTWATNAWVIGNNGTSLGFISNNVGSWAASPAAISTGTWEHYAFVRNGTAMLTFRDGVMSSSPSYFSSGQSVDGGVSRRINLGSTGQDSDGYIQGFMDDIRVTKGVARYTAGFLPPQFPFPDNVGTQVVEYPPQAMTTNSTSITTASYGNGTYVSSASSESEFSAQLAFNKVNGTAGNNAWSAGGIFNTTTGVFTGATSRGGVSGAWIEIILPSPITLTSYSIAGRNDVTFQSPVDFTLVATNDASGVGTGWVSLDTRTGISWALSENASPKVLTISPTTSYLRYAIVVSKIGPSNLSGYVVIPELRFFGY